MIYVIDHQVLSTNSNGLFQDMMIFAANNITKYSMHNILTFLLKAFYKFMGMCYKRQNSTSTKLIVVWIRCVNCKINLNYNTNHK